MVEPNTLETSEAGRTSRPLLLEIVLHDGERIHALVDEALSRAELGTLHTRLATEPFVLIGERTVVRARTCAQYSFTTAGRAAARSSHDKGVDA